MSGEPWSPINEEGQSYLARKEQERCDSLRKSLTMPEPDKRLFAWPSKPETHPVQQVDSPKRVPKVVSMRAYEVYCGVFSSQEAMVIGECRGGFGIGELIGFLYARSFPKEEWRQRFEEAINGMVR